MEARTWIVDGVRTPIGAMNGALASVPAPGWGRRASRPCSAGPGSRGAASTK